MNSFESLYKELRKKYGAPQGQWSLWCKRPKSCEEREEVAIGAILTQITNWKNVELAMGNLKKAKACSLEKILKLGQKRLAPLIRPSGFYKIKAGYLFNLARFIIKEYGTLGRMKKKNESNLREKLLSQKGVGPETADSILLYALDKPIFVIDEYTKRLVKERGLAEKMNYGFLQELFEKNFKKDYEFYQDFHALIVINGKKQNGF